NSGSGVVVWSVLVNKVLKEGWLFFSLSGDERRSKLKKEFVATEIRDRPSISTLRLHSIQWANEVFFGSCRQVKIMTRGRGIPITFEMLSEAPIGAQGIRERLARIY